MRVTQTTMTRNYMRNLNKTAYNYQHSMDKIASGKRFTKMSEAVADGAKALRIRTQLYRNTQMQKNLYSAKEALAVAETNLYSMKTVLDTSHENALRAQNGTINPAQEFETFAQIFSSHKDQIFQWSNATYGDKYLFGGNNNGGYPFSEDRETGEILYNGIPVKNIIYDSESGEYLCPDPDVISDFDMVRWQFDDDGNGTMIIPDTAAQFGTDMFDTGQPALEFFESDDGVMFAFDQGPYLSAQSGIAVGDIYRGNDGKYYYPNPAWDAAHPIDPGPPVIPAPPKQFTVFDPAQPTPPDIYNPIDYNTPGVSEWAVLPFTPFNTDDIKTVSDGNTPAAYTHYYPDPANPPTEPFDPLAPGPQWLTLNPADVTEITQWTEAPLGKVPYSDDLYMDIGLNITVTGNLLDKKSAVNVSSSGLTALGFGMSKVSYTSADHKEYEFEIPNQICEILREMSSCLISAKELYSAAQEMNDTGSEEYVTSMQEYGEQMAKFAALDVHLQKQTTGVVTEMSGIGVRTNYIESTLSRFEDEELTLQEMQMATEKINDSEEITTMRSHEFAWNLTLQFGSMFLPKSLMDYVS